MSPPLSIHPKKVNHQQLAQRILQENPILGQRIAEKCTIAPQNVLTALTETIRFLNLIVFSEKKLTPGETIDTVWHEFILCTRAYAQFCENVFGRFVHHAPGGTEAENKNQYRMTLKLYQLYYGAMPHDYWGHVPYGDVESNCGPCESQ